MKKRVSFPYRKWSRNGQELPLPQILVYLADTRSVRATAQHFGISIPGLYKYLSQHGIAVVPMLIIGQRAQQRNDGVATDDST
jgi:hypothetical protein